MNAEDIAKIYVAVGVIFVMSWAFKLIRRKDGKSGWSRLRCKAEKDGVMTSESFAYSTLFMIALMAFAWPIVLADTLTSGKKSRKDKP